MTRVKAVTITAAAASMLLVVISGSSNAPAGLCALSKANPT